MNLEHCRAKIDRYLTKKNGQALIVDVQNQTDLAALIQHYHVGKTELIQASSYCNEDEFPRLDTMFEALSRKEGVFFVTGVSSFLKLQGDRELIHTLGELLTLPVAGRVVMLTFQCRRYLNLSDPRRKTQIAVVDGEEQPTPQIIFVSPAIPIPSKAAATTGLHSFASAIEHCQKDRLYVVTNKEREAFPTALYPINSLRKAYDALVQLDGLTVKLGEQAGTEAQWEYALGLFKGKRSWADVIDAEFGNQALLGHAVSNYKDLSANRRWLYFIALKLCGAKGNWCLTAAAAKASAIENFAACIYRSILEKDPDDPEFWDDYDIRSATLNALGNPGKEASDYCKTTLGKGKDALYYFTDHTQQEREAIFTVLDQYGSDYDRDTLCGILKKVYPELFAYLQPYRFKNELLDHYFQDYKYQKVINKVYPEFKSVVEDQAQKREYNRILPPRSSVIESLNRDGAQLYFMDAMGVEYLGYILSVCRELTLLANITICRCELPSITSKNNEFLALFASCDEPTVSVQDIDGIKHHGKDDYDYYRHSKLPIHLSAELAIIRDVLTKIAHKLEAGTISRAYMIADHGASRLAVLYDTENIWEMSEKGEHSGRCCPKSDVDTQPDFAADAGDFWALANYDRFRGGRKANVEVHGGATLEEVCVPIVELIYHDAEIEVYLLPADADTVDFTHTPEIEVSFRKKAALKIYATVPLQNVSLSVNGLYYDAEALENGYYRVMMPNLKKPGPYYADVYAGGNVVAEHLPFAVKQEGQQEKELL